MTEYEYFRQSFTADETIEIPDDAIGVTVSTFGDPHGSGHAWVRYLVPVDGGTT